MPVLHTFHTISTHPCTLLLLSKELARETRVLIFMVTGSYWHWWYDDKLQVPTEIPKPGGRVGKGRENVYHYFAGVVIPWARVWTLSRQRVSQPLYVSRKFQDHSEVRVKLNFIYYYFQVWAGAYFGIVVTLVQLGIFVRGTFKDPFRSFEILLDRFGTLWSVLGAFSCFEHRELLCLW